MLPFRLFLHPRKLLAAGSVESFSYGLRLCEPQSKAGIKMVYTESCKGGDGTHLWLGLSLTALQLPGRWDLQVPSTYCHKSAAKQGSLPRCMNSCRWRIRKSANGSNFRALYDTPSNITPPERNPTAKTKVGPNLLVLRNVGTSPGIPIKETTRDENRQNPSLHALAALCESGPSVNLIKSSSLARCEGRRLKSTPWPKDMTQD